MKIRYSPAALPSALSMPAPIQLPEFYVADGVLNSDTTCSSASAGFTSAITGKTVVGIGIPTGTTVTYVDATHVTLSQAATVTATGVVLTFVTGAYPLRNTSPAGPTQFQPWRGAIPPTIGSGYMTAGVDEYWPTG